MSDSLDLDVKISVVVPVFNREKELSQCLDSVLGQNLKEIEVICIDDGSTDRSPELLAEYARRDGRIRVVCRENRGVGPTRNECMAMARGEFIAFMDPDDFYPTHKTLTILYSAAKKNNADICGGTLIVYDPEKNIKTERRDDPDFFKKPGFVSYRDFQRDYGYTRYIYKRELLERHAVGFPAYRRFQDPPFFVKAMIAAKKFYAVPEPVYVYRWARKFSNWDEENIRHLLCAIEEDLMMAVDAGLWDLFDLTLSKYQIDFKAPIAAFNGPRIEEVENRIKKLALSVYRDRISSIRVSQNPAISVIVPIYNADRYLRQCLESMRQQTMRDFEVICVNDGSSDFSLKIIKDFCERDSRFLLINKLNSGYGHSMNCGLSAAAGKYVAIIEPDDFIKPNMFGRLFTRAEAEDVDFVKGGLYFHWSGRPDKRVPVTVEKSLLNRVLDPVRELKIFDALMNNVTGIYRRSFIERNGVRFNETPGASYQDNGFYLRAHFSAKKVLLLDEEFYVYRQDNENSSCNSKDKAFAIFEEFRLNDAILKSDGAEKKFIGVYVYKKFKSFKFHLARIEDSCKLEFLRKMSEVLKEHEARNEIDWDILSPGHRGVMKVLLTNYRAYYDRIMENAREVAAGRVKVGSQRCQVPVRSAISVDDLKWRMNSRFLRLCVGGLLCLDDNGWKYTVKLFVSKCRGWIKHKIGLPRAH